MSSTVIPKRTAIAPPPRINLRRVVLENGSQRYNSRRDLGDRVEGGGRSSIHHWGHNSAQAPMPINITAKPTSKTT